MVPAALATGRRMDLVQSRPQPQCAISNSKQWRLQPPVSQAPRHTSPALRALRGSQAPSRAIPSFHPPSLQPRAATPSSPCPLRLQARPVYPYVGIPYVGIATGVEATTLTLSALVPPTTLQSHDRVGAQRRRPSHQLPKRRLEVPDRQPLHVQLPKQLPRLTTRPLIPLHYLRLEAFRRHLGQRVRYPWRLHLHRRHAHRQLPTPVVAVSVSAKLIGTLVSLPS